MTYLSAVLPYKFIKLTPLFFQTSCPTGAIEVSYSMVQLSTPQATHLGLTIILSHKAMILDIEHQIQSLTVPSSKEEILPFLGIGGFLFSGIPLFLFLLTL